MVNSFLQGIRNNLLARKQTASLNSALEGGVGHPGTGAGGDPTLPFGGYPPEAFGNRAGYGYRGPSPSTGTGDQVFDDTDFLNSLAANRGPDSFKGTIAASAVTPTGEPVVSVPTTYAPSYGQPSAPGMPSPSDLMPSLNLANVNAAIRSSAVPNLSDRPGQLLSERPGGRSADLGGYGQPAGFFPNAAYNSLGSEGIGGRGGSFYSSESPGGSIQQHIAGIGPLDQPGGVPLHIGQDAPNMAGVYLSSARNYEPNQAMYNNFYGPGSAIQSLWKQGNIPTYEEWAANFPAPGQATAGRPGQRMAGTRIPGASQ